jgi:hypothetical protein
MVLVLPPVHMSWDFEAHEPSPNTKFEAVGLQKRSKPIRLSSSAIIIV